MKTPLEIVWCPDGTAFLNFWDNIGGSDVCLQIDTGGVLRGEDGCEVKFSDFLVQVEQVVKPYEWKDVE